MHGNFFFVKRYLRAYEIHRMKLDLPEASPTHPFQAYIFDCDGTIADTMPLHYEAWGEALGEHAHVFTREMHYGWGGMPNHAIVEKLNREFGLTLDPGVVIPRKEQGYLDRVHRVQPVEPVVDLVRQFHGTAPMAVASGGHRDLVESTLAALEIRHLFSVVVTSGDYQKGKPDPEPFLLAAEKMGVAPGACLVFEDTPTGIEAARRAGMRYVLVPTAPTDL
jgi:HAD superfamily hydrolase (TIGR01509 family)